MHASKYKLKGAVQAAWWWILWR